MMGLALWLAEVSIGLAAGSLALSIISLRYLRRYVEALEASQRLAQTASDIMSVYHEKIVAQNQK